MHSLKLRYWLNKWPGEKIFGIYRFLPLFFILGATLEFSMISWRVGETNFCNINYNYLSKSNQNPWLMHFHVFVCLDSTFKRKQAEKIARHNLGLDV